MKKLVFTLATCCIMWHVNKNRNEPVLYGFRTEYGALILIKSDRTL